MARTPKTPVIDDTSLPYRVVIDFLEGTLRKQDAVSFARGFIEHHFDATSNSGYFVAPYEAGYIFEAHEGGLQRAYLPGILKTLQTTPTASACVQMARRVLEVKKSVSGVYTAILLPEGTEPQNLDKVFPEPGPKLVPYEKSGLGAMMTGIGIFGAGLVTLLLATTWYLVEVSGLMQPSMATVDYKSLPLTQWPNLERMTAGPDKDKYVRTIRMQNGKWQFDTSARREAMPDQPASALSPSASGPLADPLALPPQALEVPAAKPNTAPGGTAH